MAATTEQVVLDDKAVDATEHEVTTQITRDNAAENRLGLWQTIRKWPKITGYCMGLTAGILLYGYDLVIVGTVSAMPAFQYVAIPFFLLRI